MAVRLRLPHDVDIVGYVDEYLQFFAVVLPRDPLVITPYMSGFSVSFLQRECVDVAKQKVMKPPTGALHLQESYDVARADATYHIIVENNH